MSTLRWSAFACFALAVGVAALGLVVSTGLVKEYGANVSPLKLAAQVAVVWLPLAAILASLGYWCLRRSKRD